MSSALTVIVLGNAFFGNFSLPNISPVRNNCIEVLGSIQVPSTTEIPNTTKLTEEPTTSIPEPEARRVIGSIQVPSTTEIPNTTELTEKSTTSIPDPKPRRPDYTYTPGVGAHKFIIELVNWNTARQLCEKDGAHLVIINSVAEAELVLRLVSGTKITNSHVGVHRLDQEGEFVTIHGEPLIQTGFAEWGAGEPNNPDTIGPENCVELQTGAKLNNIPCDSIYAKWVVCELPLTAF